MHYVVLYPQNGDRIVTIDCDVTSPNVSVIAVFCLGILQLQSIGLSFVWRSVCLVQLLIY